MAGYMYITEETCIVEICIWSRKIVDEADESTSVNLILNMILKLVSSIDTRLQGVEKSVGKFDELKNIITSVTSRVVTVEKM